MKTEAWQSGHFRDSENVLEPRAKRGVRDLSLIMDKSIYDQSWYVYIAECRDNTLYVGIARDVEKRISDHNTTNKCRYTRFRKPLIARFTEICDNYNQARKREIEIKRFSRSKKLKLIGC